MLNARLGDAWVLAGPGGVRELRALEHIDDDLGAWQAADDNVRSAVSLLYPAGHPVYRAGDPVAEFLLHIDGEDAW